MSHPSTENRSFISTLQEYSVPLLAGVVIAVVMATVMGEPDYHHLVDMNLAGDFTLFGYHITPHWLINDIFMVFFFGIAAKEITEAMLPGGALNPPSKAVNPLLGTIGGVVGPVAVYLLLTQVFMGGAAAEDLAAVKNGWGIPTATDIALAWLVARMIFGGTHPAVNFLLLLAIADDAIGLIIIAVKYPNPAHPVDPIWLLLVVAGALVAFGLRKGNVKSWIPYVGIAGVIAWIGLIKTGVHPALALVPIVPFMPAGHHDDGLFVEEDDGSAHAHSHSTLDNFEHSLKAFVDFGLFFFGITNAGVAISGEAIQHPVVLIVLGALIIGKTIGIAFFSGLGNMLGFKYPEGMGFKHVLVAGMVAGMGLTVALFVAGVAFPPEHADYQAAAKMGALLSAGAALLAFAMGKVFKVKDAE